MSDLGEVKIRLEEEDAQEAADTIGDAMAESGESSGSGGGGGDGSIGGMLGGISTKLAGILGFVAFLATLKPIQELLGGLQRLFSVAILPLVALLNAFLRPIMERLLRFIGELDFDNLLQDLVTKIVSAIKTGVSELFSFGGPGGSGVDGVTRFGGPDASGEGFRDGPGGFGSVGRGSPAENIFLRLGLLSEQSNTSMDDNVVDTNSEVVINQGPGGQ